MDGFADNFVPAAENILNSDDPAAEFLAREQHQLAGLEDDIPPAVVLDHVQTNGVGDFFMVGDKSYVESAQHTFFDDFDLLSENIVPGISYDEPEDSPQILLSEAEVELGSESLPTPPENALNSHDFTDEVNLDADPEPVPVQTPSPPAIYIEPEKIRIWREQQRVRLEEKDAAEQISKEELKERAKKEIEEWYRQHEEQVAKTRQANRSAEKELVADTGKMVPGTEWERIAKLCDFNPKTAKSSRDISRMRSIILQVKKNPPNA